MADQTTKPRFTVNKQQVIGLIILVLFVIWVIKPTQIDIECLGCVNVKPDAVGATVSKPTHGIVSNNNAPPKPKTDKKPTIELHQTCVGEIRLPRRIAPLPDIPEHIKSNPQHYIDALTHQLETQTVQINEYQNHVEEIIEKYNLSCK